jgi:hypothetical protein
MEFSPVSVRGGIEELRGNLCCRCLLSMERWKKMSVEVRSARVTYIKPRKEGGKILRLNSGVVVLGVKWQHPRLVDYYLGT